MDVFADVTGCCFGVFHYSLHDPYVLTDLFCVQISVCCMCIVVVFLFLLQCSLLPPSLNSPVQPVPAPVQALLQHTTNDKVIFWNAHVTVDYMSVSVRYIVYIYIINNVCI